jgi:hypothetical protein
MSCHVMSCRADSAIRCNVRLRDCFDSFCRTRHINFQIEGDRTFGMRSFAHVASVFLLFLSTSAENRDPSTPTAGCGRRRNKDSSRAKVLLCKVADCCLTQSLPRCAVKRGNQTRLLLHSGDSFGSRTAIDRALLFNNPSRAALRSSAR